MTFDLGRTVLPEVRYITVSDIRNKSIDPLREDLRNIVHSNSTSYIADTMWRIVSQTNKELIKRGKNL